MKFVVTLKGFGQNLFNKIINIFLGFFEAIRITVSDVKKLLWTVFGLMLLVDVSKKGGLGFISFLTHQVAKIIQTIADGAWPIVVIVVFFFAYLISKNK